MTDTAAQSRNSHDGRSERRRYARLELKSMAFLDIGPDNGGIVLNISETGIALQAMSALPPKPVIDLHLRPPKSSKRIQVNGKVVWTTSKGEAGIQFVDLPDEARVQIRNWLTSDALPAQLPLVIPRPSETTKPLAEQQADELMGLLSELSAEAVILHPRDGEPTLARPPASPPPVPAPLSWSHAVIEKHPTDKSVLAVPPLGKLTGSHGKNSPELVHRSNMIERANKTRISKTNAASSRQLFPKSAAGQPPLVRSFITRSAEVKENHDWGGAFHAVARIFDKHTLDKLTKAATARVVSSTRELFPELSRPAFDRRWRVWRDAAQAWRRRRRSLLGWLQQPLFQQRPSSVRLYSAQSPTVWASIAPLRQLPRSRLPRRDISLSVVSRTGRFRMKAVIRWLRQPASPSHLRRGIL